MLGDSLYGDLSVVNGGSQFLGVLAVDGAAERHASAQDFFAGALEVDGHGLVVLAQGLGDPDHIIELDISIVLDVLGLLPVATALLQGLDDQGRSSGQHADSALSVEHLDLNLDFDSSPGSGGFLDVFANLLGGETNGTALGGKGCGGGDLTTNNFHVHWMNRTYGTWLLQQQRRAWEA